MDGKERNRLSGGIAIGKAEPRQPKNRQETENQSRDCELGVRRGRRDGSAPQQQCNAAERDECAANPEFPHAQIIPDPGDALPREDVMALDPLIETEGHQKGPRIAETGIGVCCPLDDLPVNRFAHVPIMRESAVLWLLHGSSARRMAIEHRSGPFRARQKLRQRRDPPGPETSPARLFATMGQ